MPEKRESVGALWIKMSAAGNEYFSLQVEGKCYVAFLNDYKTTKEQPDYRIYPRLENPKEKEAPF